MNSAESEFSLKELFCSREIYRILEEYILSCSADASEALSDGNSEKEENQSKKAKARTGRAKASISVGFPNLAGFCRYLGVGTEEYRHTCEDFPDAADRISAVLEDEALNSALSPTILTAYLKKRCGYASSEPPPAEPQLTISFEHDIFEDGE